MEQQVRNAQGVEQLLRTLFTSHVYRMFTHFIAVALMQHHTEAVKAQNQGRLLHHCLRE